METVGETIHSVLGLDAQKLTFWQMGARAVIVYVAGLAMVRLGGDRRFIGQYAAFDVILSIMLGATLSRAINGSAAFFPTLGAAWVLVGLHWLLSLLSFHFDQLEATIKGRSRVLIQDGQLCQRAMRKSHISRRDLDTALRLKAKLTDPSQVALAYLESSGDISVIPKE
ncbi:MAG: DUF421 domain-containing protein [Cyanobacteriota bacterium]|nr:DUF421 domain-containing protein [Cyanobacteriota bacterium]